MMNPVYRRAQFSGSAHSLRQLPDEVTSEVAFAGRSNAGKSSAINTLTGNRKLARTSRTPGRTQLINHFELGDGYFLVDLPGYGYAKVSHDKRRHWAATLGRYLSGRDCLRCLVVVMDIRHALTDADWDMIELQQQGSSDLHLLLTKADKLNRNKQMQALMQAQRACEEAGIEATLQTFSSSTGEGLEDLHSVLDQHLFGGRPADADDSGPG